MAINLSSLAPATTAASSLTALILVTPQQNMPMKPQLQDAAFLSDLFSPDDAVDLPSNIPDIDAGPSLIFQYVGEQTAMMRAEITDHFVEDNTTIQNNIAFRPDVYTVHGYVGEVNNVVPEALQILKAAADKLVIMGGYTPNLTTTALIAYNEAVFGYQIAANAAKAAVSTWRTASSLFNNGSTDAIIGADGIGVDTGDFNPVTAEVDKAQNNQQTMFQQLYGYMKNRFLFTVTTPWCVFQDMAIESFRSIQEADTQVITDFEVTFKMIRTAEVEELSSKDVAGRLNAQASPGKQLGTNQGSTVSGSTSSQLSNAGYIA